jgi:hypothetical protein
MVAKIADLGVARLVPRLRAATMTKAPGASIYMPPEALEDKSKYDVTIDIFSLGVMAIFTLSQTFPDPLAAAYMDEEGRMVGRTELERRGNYMREVRSQLRQGHPLVTMIQRCLKNRIRERPSIQGVVGWLEKARAEAGDRELDVDKLSLAQLLHSREQQLRQQVDSMGQQISDQKKENDTQKGEINTRKEQVDLLRAQNASLEEHNQSLQAENASLRQRQQTTPPVPTPRPPKSGASPLTAGPPPQRELEPETPVLGILPPHLRKKTAGAVAVNRPPSHAPGKSSASVQSLQWPLPLTWRRGKDAPTDQLLWASSVVIGGVVYCGGNHPGSRVVVQYSPESGDWSELPSPPVPGFAMTSLNGRLVLAGGGWQAGDARIRVWDSGRREWVHPYPPMPTGRGLSAAVGYQNYLIVACGAPHRDEVEVLDSSSGRWYRAQPVPVGGHWMSSVVVGDRWYLSSFGQWKDGKKHIFWAHLPTLTSSATSAHTTTESVWHELPTPPVAEPTLLALQGHLLLVGGGGYEQEIHRYDLETSQWRECGRLPVGMDAPCCAVLPSGDLMVAGGVTGDTKSLSSRMWIGHIQS